MKNKLSPILIKILSNRISANLIALFCSLSFAKEIAEIFNITVPVMTKGVKKCQEIISMNKQNSKRLLYKNSIQPHDFIERFCNKLNIDPKDINEIKDICNIVMENNITIENTPPSKLQNKITKYTKKLKKSTKVNY